MKSQQMIMVGIAILVLLLLLGVIPSPLKLTEQKKESCCGKNMY